METKWQAYRRREREREDLTDTLLRGTREINTNLNELEGWADRVMAAVLKPAGDEALLWYDSFRTKNAQGAIYKREQ